MITKTFKTRLTCIWCFVYQFASLIFLKTKNYFFHFLALGSFLGVTLIGLAGVLTVLSVTGTTNLVNYNKSKLN